MSEQEFEGPRVTDRRRVDPDSGEVRQPATQAAAPDPLLAEAVEAALVDVEVTEVESKLAELRQELESAKRLMTEQTQAAKEGVEKLVSDATDKKP